MLGRQHMDAKGFYALSLVAGTSIAVYYIWMKNKRNPKPKEDWKEVGTVANLYIYPMKSSRNKPLNKAEVTGKGLKEIRDDNLLPLSDRVFVIFRADNGEFLTGRTYPKLIGISVTSVSEDTVKFSFNGVEPLMVKIPTESKDEVIMWESEKIPTADCGDEASNWISNLLQVEKPVRMGYWSQSIKTRRDISNYQKEKSKFYDIRPEHTGAYSDLSGFLLINESSVKDIIPRLTPGSTPITHKNFRPNIVIDGPKPYEEDNWKWIKIGENAIFKAVSPCTRCSLTTINPETMIRDKNMEPIKTLKTYRTAKDEKAKKIDGTSPYMGINLGLYQAGIIAAGDLVYVSD